MVFVLIALWTIAAILLIINPKNEPTRWAALTAFTGGGGGLSRAVTETILPYLDKHQISTPAFDAWLFKLHLAGSFMNHNGLPYCFLMFAISYSGLFRRKVKTILLWTLPVPILVMLWITPFSPDIQLNFQVLFSWCVPYLITGIILLMYSFVIEKNVKRKKSRLFSNLVAFPPILFQIVANYTLKAFFDIQEIWRFMPFVITVLLMSFLLLGIKYGVLGVRLKFEKDRLDGTMRAISYGTNVLNHTIKNEVGKIRIVTDQIRMLASSSHQENIANEATVVLDSTNHMLEMVSRIQSRTQEIVLKEEVNDIKDTLSRALLMSKLHLNERNIQVIIEDMRTEVFLFCDPVHMQETFHNIIVNAAEAMEPGGTLTISMHETRKHIVFVFKDSGKGISKDELSCLFDPFFSTKHRKTNYGLGLTYCYNVLQQHGGSIEVQSELHIGTTVTIQLPKKRIRPGILPYTEVRDIGADQSHVS
ncbi:sensor histidine kinase [Paenibacillus validus]|uniref:sensor histidine kinase n=1 Tax=Paenibacillus validus TaxID=44253 RepID=UPI003D27B944